MVKSKILRFRLLPLGEKDGMRVISEIVGTPNLFLSRKVSGGEERWIGKWIVRFAFCFIFGLGIFSHLNAMEPPVPDVSKEQRAKDFLTLGNQLEKRGAHEKAVEFWKIAAELDPTLKEAVDKSGLKRDGPAPPVPEIKGVQREKLEGYKEKARKAYSENDYGAAKKYVDLATQIAARDEEVLFLKRKIALETFSDEPGRPYNMLVRNFFEEGVDQYRHGRAPEALDKLKQALRLDPGNPQVRALLTQIRAESAGIEAARETQRAKSEWEAGNGEISLEILEGVLKHYPNYPSALELKTQILWASGNKQSEGAGKNLARAVKAEKENRFALAHKYYLAALKADPGNQEAKKGVDRTASLVDSLGDKTRELEGAIASGRKDKAQAALDEIVRLSPEDNRIPGWRRKVNGLGKSNEVTEDSRAKADGTYNLGLESYRKGDLAAAKRYWTQTLEWDPRNAQAKKNLERLQSEHPELK